VPTQKQPQAAGFTCKPLLTVKLLTGISHPKFMQNDYLPGVIVGVHVLEG
jgi:hypothetical protein